MCQIIENQRKLSIFLTSYCTIALVPCVFVLTNHLPSLNVPLRGSIFEQFFFKMKTLKEGRKKLVLKRTDSKKERFNGKCKPADCLRSLTRVRTSKVRQSSLQNFGSQSKRFELIRWHSLTFL